jgi:hypothetical protein
MHELVSNKFEPDIFGLKMRAERLQKNRSSLLPNWNGFPGKI